MTSRRTPRLRSLASAALAGALLLTLGACAGQGNAQPASDGAEDTSRIVLGADDGTEAHWAILKQKLADEGIDLEVRTINDGVQLNQGV